MDNTLLFRAIGVSRANRNKIGEFWNNFFSPKLLSSAKVWILTPQRHDAGANCKALYLFRAFF